MTHVAANQPVDPGHHASPAYLNDPALRSENITLEPARVGMAWKALVGLGIVGIVVAILGAFLLQSEHTSANAAITHVKGILFIGVLSVLGFSLGSLFFIMINAVGAAGWHVTMKRMLEQSALLVWLPAVGVLLFAVSEIISVSADNVGVVSSWLNPSITKEEYFIH